MERRLQCSQQCWADSDAGRTDRRLLEDHEGLESPYVKSEVDFFRRSVHASAVQMLCDEKLLAATGTLILLLRAFKMNRRNDITSTVSGREMRRALCDYVNLHKYQFTCDPKSICLLWFRFAIHLFKV